MFTAKDVINEAFDRSGVFPNSTDGLPGEYFAQGLNILRGLVSFYNTRNYITATQRSLRIQVPPGCTITLARTEPDAVPYIDRCASVSTVYVAGEERNIPLTFTSFQSFPGYCNGSRVYTWQEIDDESVTLKVQPWAIGRDLIVVYNVPFDCDADTEWRLPAEYKELFILGLAMKLLTVYPRENDAQRNGIGEELNALTAAIVAKQASAKTLEWNANAGVPSRSEQFRSGSFLRK